jgi:hypothetical protein
MGKIRPSKTFRVKSNSKRDAFVFWVKEIPIKNHLYQLPTATQGRICAHL